MHRDLILALGGTKAVAQQIRQPRSVVSNWQKRGVPWRWRPEIASLARRKRVKLPADFLAANGHKDAA